MSFLGALGGAAGSATPWVIWALGAVVVVLAVVALVAVRGASRNKTAVAGAERGDAVFAVAETCRSKGHAYQEFDTGWRCATCGNHVPRQEGELYGLVSDGRHERRRSGR
jgi:hypothetical protein